MLMRPPTRQPITSEKKLSPLCSGVNEYTSWNTSGKATKKEYIVAKLKATYRERAATMGSINSMCIGRVNVTVTKSFNAESPLGPGGAADSAPASFLLRARMVFLYVSLLKKTLR
jgi:hypothetical protein